jgi:Mn-dependent DtxR family transcriptional regulator
MNELLQKSILSLLKKEEFGLLHGEIARRLNISRTTIAKELAVMEAQNKITFEPIGAYKLYRARK